MFMEIIMRIHIRQRYTGKLLFAGEVLSLNMVTSGPPAAQCTVTVADEDCSLERDGIHIKNKKGFKGSSFSLSLFWGFFFFSPGV
jgi:hypothetical protein